MIMRFLSTFLAVVFFFGNVVLLHAQESNFWKDRQEKVEAQSQVSQSSKLARLPQLQKAFNPISSNLESTPLKDGSLSPLLSSPNRNKKGRDPRLASIPLNLGTIKDVHLSLDRKAPLLLLIQDIHFHNEAQRNIADILNALAVDYENKKKTPLTIGVEGAFGAYDFSRFRAFDNKEVSKLFNDHMFEKGEIAAPSYVGLSIEKANPTFIGIDSLPEYEKNVQAYVQSEPIREKSKSFLAKLKAELDGKKATALNPRLREFDSLQESFQAKNLSLGQYIKALDQIFRETQKSRNVVLDYVHELILDQFLNVYEIEGELDFQLIEKQRNHVVEKLAEVLKQDEIDQLGHLSLLFHSGQVSYADYYRAIRNLLDRHSISLENLPDFRRFIQYVLMAESLNVEELFSALRRLESTILHRLATTKLEKDLMKQSRLLYLQSRLLEFGLTSEEWDEYKALPKRTDKAFLVGFESFYEAADKRSYEMVENISRELDKDQKRSSQLIVAIMGGFHTSLVTDIVKEKGFSYAVVQPKITKVDEKSGTSYLSIFTRDKTPLEKLFEGEQLFLAVAGQALGNYNSRTVGLRWQHWLGNVSAYLKRGLSIPEAAGLTVVQNQNQTVRVTDNQTNQSVTIGNNAQHGNAIPSPEGDLFLVTKNPGLSLRDWVDRVILTPLKPWEIVFPVLSQVLLPLISYSPILIILTLSVNAVLFAVIHPDNWVDGQFQWNRFSGRVVGASIILLASYNLANQSFISSFNYAFLGYNTAFHMAWNLAVNLIGKSHWQLTVAAPNERSARERILQEKIRTYQEVLRTEYANIESGEGAKDSRETLGKRFTRELLSIGGRDHSVGRTRKLANALTEIWEDEGNQARFEDFPDIENSLVNVITAAEDYYQELDNFLADFPDAKKKRKKSSQQSKPEPVSKVPDDTKVTSADSSQMDVKKETRKTVQPKRPAQRRGIESQNPTVEPAGNRRFNRLSSLFMSIGILSILIIYAPSLVEMVLKVGNFNPAIGAPVGFMFTEATPVTYLGVAIIAIMTEGGYRIVYEVLRFFTNSGQEITYRDQDGQSYNDGIEIGYLSTADDYRKAIRSRFSFGKRNDPRLGNQFLIEDKDLGGLSLEVLRQLYYELDEIDRKMAKDQSLRTPGQTKQTMMRAFAKDGPIGVLVWSVKHLFNFMKVFFFETHLKRNQYRVQGRFINHFESAEMAGSIVFAAIERARTKNSYGYSFGESVGVWYYRNNIFLAGLGGYLYRRIWVTVFGFAGGWVLLGLGSFLPIAEMTLDPLIQGGTNVPVDAAEVTVHQAGIGGNFVSNLFYAFIHHVSFSATAVLSSGFTGLGLAVKGQVSAVHRSIVTEVTNPFGPANQSENMSDFEKHLADIRPSQVDFSSLREAVRRIRDEVRPSNNSERIAIIEIILRTEALLQAQEVRGHWALGRFTEEQRNILRSDLNNLLPNYRESRSTLIDAERVKLLSRIPNLMSRAVRRHVMKRIFRWGFLPGYMWSVGGMWSLGGEIAVARELTGDMFSIVGVVPGITMEDGERFGENIIDLLEGEHNSAMTLMSDMQTATLSMVGFLAVDDVEDQFNDAALEAPNQQNQQNLNLAQAPAPIPPADLNPAGPGDPPPPPDGVPLPPANRLPGVPQIYTWIPEADQLSAARWGMWQLDMRDKAEEYLENNDNEAIELPEIALDQFGIPLLTEVNAGKASLIIQDGNVTESQTIDSAHSNYNKNTKLPRDASRAYFDPERRVFVAPEGKTFRYVRLSSDVNQAPFTDENGSALLDTSGQEIKIDGEKWGFRTHRDNDINGRTVNWRDSIDGSVHDVYPDGRSVVPVHPITEFEVLLGLANELADDELAKALSDLEALRWRIRMIETKLNSPNEEEVLVVDHDTYRFTGYGELNDLANNFVVDEDGKPRLEYWNYDADGNRVQFYPEFSLDPEAVADEITIQDPAGKEYLVEFTINGNKKGEEARVDAEASRLNTIGNLSVAAHPNATLRTPPIFMLIESKVNGEITPIYSIRQAALWMRLQTGFNESTTIPQLLGDFRLDQQTKFEGANVIVWTNDDREFKEKWMDWYQRNGFRGAFGLRFNTDPESGEPKGLSALDLSLREAKKIRKDGLFSRDRDNRVQINKNGEIRINTIHNNELKPTYLSEFEILRLQRRGEIYLAGQGVYVVKMIYNDGVVSRATRRGELSAEILMNADLDSSNGVFYEVISDEQYRQMSGNKMQADIYDDSGDSFVKLNLGYMMRDGEVVRAYDDPKDLQELLTKSTLEFQLSTAQDEDDWVKPEELPALMRQKGITVIGIRDTDPNNLGQIYTGSEWLRLNYNLSEAVRAEFAGRPWRLNRVPPEVVVITPTGRMHTSYHPAWERELVKATEQIKADLRVEKDPVAREILHERLRKATQENTFQLGFSPKWANFEWTFWTSKIGGKMQEIPGLFDLRGSEVIIKGRPIDYAAQSMREYTELARSFYANAVFGSGRGGVIGIPGGEFARALDFYQQEIRRNRSEWNAEIERERGLARDSKVRNRQQIRESNEKQKELAAHEKHLLAEARKILKKQERSEKRIGTETALRPFEDLEDYEQQLEQQSQYLRDQINPRLRELTELEKSRPLTLEEESEKRLLEHLREGVLGHNSYYHQGRRGNEGNEFILVPPVVAAEERARNIEEGVQLDSELVHIQEKLLKGEQVGLHWTTKRGENNQLEISFEMVDVGEGKRALADYKLKMEQMIDDETDPDEKSKLQEILERALKRGHFRDVNPQGEGHRWFIVDDKFKEGGTIRVIRDPSQSGREAYFIDILPVNVGERSRDLFIADRKAKLAAAADQNERDKWDRQIQKAQDKNVINYSFRGRLYSRMILYNLDEAQAQLEKETLEQQVARGQADTDDTYVFEVEEGENKVPKIITDPDEVDEHKKKLAKKRAELGIQYQTLLDDLEQAQAIPNVARRAARMTTVQQEIKEVAEELKEVTEGIYVENNRRYIIKFRSKDAELLFTRQERLLRYDERQKTAIYDANEIPVGTVMVSPEGNTVFTEAKVVDHDVDGNTVVETRTYVGGKLKPGTGDLNQDKGVLASVQQVVVDKDQRIRYVISGPVEDGEFKKYYVTEGIFEGPLADIDLASEGHTYRYEEGLPFAEYQAKAERVDDLSLDDSRVVRSPVQDILRDNRVTITRVDSLGNQWEEVKDLSGRLLEKIEGVVRAGNFIPLKKLVFHYDYENYPNATDEQKKNAADYTLLNIPVYTTVEDVDSGEEIGHSVLLTPFDRYVETGEIRYARWDEIEKTWVWEVKNLQGDLVRKYALKPIIGFDREGESIDYNPLVHNENQISEYIPYNVTLFIYDFKRDAHGFQRLAGRAYTFLTDKDGDINGRYKRLPDGTIHGDYFEYTELSEIQYTPTGEGRIIYNVSVRNGGDADFEQFQEMKAPDGRLLVRIIGHRSGRFFIPEKVTFNEYLLNGENNYGRYSIPDMSRTYKVFFPDPAMGESWDFTNLHPTENYEQGPLLANGLPSFEMILEEESDIRNPGIDENGVLTYDRTSYRYQLAANGEPKPNTRAKLEDRIFQGNKIHFYNEGRKRTSRPIYDDKKNQESALVYDNGDHPSVENQLVQAEPGLGILIEDVERTRKAIMPNDHLPDLPAQDWNIYNVSYKSITEEDLTVFESKRWRDVYGAGIVEENIKKNEEGRNDREVYINLYDDYSADYKYRRDAQNQNPLTIEMKPPRDGANGQYYDLSGTAFLYFNVDRADTILPKGDLSVTVTYKDKDGNTATFNSDRNEFWVSGIRHKHSENYHVILKAESIFQNKDFMFAVPVSELAAAGLDVENLNRNVEVKVTSNEPGLVRITDVHRAGAPRDPPRVDEDAEIPAEINREEPIQDQPAQPEPPQPEPQAQVPENNEENPVQPEPEPEQNNEPEPEPEAVPENQEENQPERQLRFTSQQNENVEIQQAAVLSLAAVIPDLTNLEGIDIPTDEELQDRRLSFHFEDPSGQTALYDATQFSREGGRGIEIWSSGNVLLGVVRAYYTNSATTGQPLEQRWLVLFDESGDYTIGKVKLSEDGTPLFDNPENIIAHAVQDEGNYVHVFEKDPKTNPRYPVVSTYRKDSINPAQPVDMEVGMSRLPALDADDPNSKQTNRAYNSPYYFLVRLFKGESFRYHPVEVEVEDLKKAEAKIKDSVLTEIMSRLDGMNEDLPEPLRPSYEADEVPTFNFSVWNFLLFLPIILWKVWVYLWSWLSEIRYKAWRAIVDARKRDPNRFKLFDEKLMMRALKRFNNNVVEVKVRGPRYADRRPILTVSDSDIEGAFVNNSFLNYLLVYSWVEKAQFSDPALSESHLKELDELTRGVWKYLSVKTGQGSDAGTVRYPRDGKMDPQIWDNLEIYLSSYRNKLKEALLEDIDEAEEKGNPAPLRDGKFLAEYRLSLKGILKMEATAASDPYYGKEKPVLDEQEKYQFDEEAFYEYIKKHRFRPVPAFFITYGRYFLKIFPPVLGVILFKGGEVSAEGLAGPSFLVPVIILGFLISIIINAIIEVRMGQRASVATPTAKYLRLILPIAIVSSLLYILNQSDGISFGAFSFILMGLVIMGMESIGILISNRSFLGVAWRYATRPAYTRGPTRTILLVSLIYFLFVLAALLLGGTVLPWYMSKYNNGEPIKATVSLIILIARLPLLHHGVNLMTRFFFTWLSPYFGPTLAPNAKENKDHNIGILHIGGQTMASQLFTRGKSVDDMVTGFTKNFVQIYDKAPPGRNSLRIILEEAVQDPRISGINVNDIQAHSSGSQIAEEFLREMFDAEMAADGGEGTTLWSLRQLDENDVTMPIPLRIAHGESDEVKARIEYGWKLRRTLVEFLGTESGIGHNSMDTAISFVEMAEAAADFGMADNLVFYNGFNQYKDHSDPGQNPLTIGAVDRDNPNDILNRSEMGQRIKHSALIEHVSRRDGQPGARAYVVYAHNVFGLKSGGMNAIQHYLTELPNIDSIVITDRNSSRLDMRKFVDRDLRRMRDDPNMAVIVAQRNTTLILDALGNTSQLEGGHGQAMMSDPDKIGTGWMNVMATKHWETMREFGDPEAPFRNFEGSTRDMANSYGIIGFTNNAIGISEDYWAVIQQFYNMISLGYEPRVAISESLGHKMREIQDYGEWGNAPPRWSSGLVQTMNSLLNQQVNEFGPESLFQKEARQTNSDHYLLGPLVLLDLFLMPLSVVTDLSPFVGISLLFWFPGIILNQISTSNALILYIRQMGFWAGLSKYINTRVPDAMLFSSRTVRDAMSQFSGYGSPSFEFKLSGGGASAWQAIFPFLMDDDDVVRPWNFSLKNYKAAARDITSMYNTFRVGLALIAMNVWAMFNLDSTNAVMMILSLWFSIGVAFGPFLKGARPGQFVWEGVGDLLAKIVGYGLGLAFLVSMAWLRVDYLTGVLELAPIIMGATIFFGFLGLWYYQGQYQEANQLRKVRLASELQRGFWMFVLLGMWFLITPTHPIIRFDLTPTWPLEFYPYQFGLVVAGILFVLAAIMTLGKTINLIQYRRGENEHFERTLDRLDPIVQGASSRLLRWLDPVVSFITFGTNRTFGTGIQETYTRYIFQSVRVRYLELSAAHNHLDLIGLDWGQDAAIEGYLTQVRTFIQQDAYRFAHQSLDEVEKLIRLKRNWAQFNDLMDTITAAGLESDVQDERQTFVENNRRGNEVEARRVLDHLYAIAGSISAWRYLGISKETGGRIEGLLQMVGAGWVLSWLMKNGPPEFLVSLVPNALSSPLLLSPLSLSILTGIVSVVLAHFILGVYVSKKNPQSRKISDVFRASVTASVSFLLLPAVALGLNVGGILGGVVVLWSVIVGAEAHGRLNQFIENKEARQIAKVIQSKRQVSSDQKIKSDLLPIINLETRRFGIRGDINQAYQELVTDENAFIDNRFIEKQKRDSRDVIEHENLEAIPTDRESAIERYFVAPKGNGSIQVRREIRAIQTEINRARLDGKQVVLSIFLREEIESLKTDLAREFNAEIVTESDIRAQSSPRNMRGFVEDNLLRLNGNRARLKMYLTTGQELPPRLLLALTSLSKDEQYRNDIKVYILKALTQDSWVIEGSLEMLNQMKSFRDLVRSMA